MTHFETDTWPYVEAKNYRKTNGRSVRLVVIHDMEAPEKSTTAEAVANYFKNTDKSVSAHLCIDNDSIVQCVYDRHVAYAAPGANHDGIQLELAGYARQTRDEWLDAYSRAVLDNAARATAQYCLKYHLPVKVLTDDELRNGHAGIVSHWQVSRVYRKSSHTDPGANFPWDHFINEVNKYYAMYAGGNDPKPEPTKPDYEVAVIASNDIDEGMAWVLSRTYLWKFLRYPHDGVRVGHAILVGQAGNYADQYDNHTVLRGNGREHTAILVAEKIAKQDRTP